MKSILKWEMAGTVVFLVLGFGCIFFPRLYVDLFFYLVAGALSISAALMWYEVFVHPQGMSILRAIVCTAAAGILWFHRIEPHTLIIDLFAFYMLFNAACKGVQFILDIRDHTKNEWSHGLETILYLGVCLTAFAMRMSSRYILMRLLGVYILIQAIQNIIQLYFFNHPSSSRSYTFSRWTALPVYFVSVLPSIILRIMLKKKMNGKPVVMDERKNDEEVNLRVFIHTGLENEHVFGHMTFSYEGIMISYGNYDKEEEKFFRTVGPGIFFSVPADIYVNNCCIYEGSTLFEYGIHLNDEQEARLRSLLTDVFAHTYRWYSPIEQDPNGRLNFNKYESDYASRLSYRTGAKFRKFYGSKWKTYWVLGDNCSLFAEDLLSRIGAGITKKSGIVTPGEYFEFFEEKYADPKSNVITRSWHSSEVPETLYPTLA